MQKMLLGLGAGTALWLAAGVAGAAPGLPGAMGGASPAEPVAMCGNTCRNGGRYIPGPPSVCYEEGLRYCGSSRDAEPPRYRERRRDWDEDDRPRRGPGIYFGR